MLLCCLLVVVVANDGATILEQMDVDNQIVKLMMDNQIAKLMVELSRSQDYEKFIFIVVQIRISAIADKSVKGAGLRIDPKISDFQMHYPRFKKEDYEKMDEMRLKPLLGEYGLKFEGSMDQLRKYVIGTFLWPDQF
ncbi:hypothetical protein QQ045_030345 [Rhodiola kirilowii]